MFPPFIRHSDTSRLAAISVLDSARTWRAKVYRYIREAGVNGVTDDEIQRGLGLNPSTQRPRRVELVELGVIADSLDRRRTPSGRLAVVWVAIARRV